MLAGNLPASAPEWGPVPSRDRTHVLTYAALLVVTAAAWLQVLWSALRLDDMAGMDMAMPLSVFDGVVFVASWTVMMTAMMLPSALPMIALYAVTQRTWGASNGPPKPPERLCLIRPPRSPFLRQAPGF